SLLVSGALNLAGGGSAAGAITNAGSFTVAADTTFTVSGSYTQSGTLYVPATALLSLTGNFTTFAAATLTAGTYSIGGRWRFVGADLQTNAATLILDGPGAQIMDLSNDDALAHFTTNAATGSFTLQNGRTFVTSASVAFTNLGTLTIAAGSTLTVPGSF